MAMSELHRNALIRSRVYLVRNILDVPSVLRLLRRDRVLTEDMQESIEIKPTRTARVAALLDLLPRRGSQAFDRFVRALIQTEQEDCAWTGRCFESGVGERETSADGSRRESVSPASGAGYPKPRAPSAERTTDAKSPQQTNGSAGAVPDRT